MLMAVIPGKRVCDLCRNEIPAGVKFPTMNYPLDREDVRRLLEPKASGNGLDIFSGMRAFAQASRSEAVQFEFCRSCVDGILPMLPDLKTRIIHEMVEHRARAREQEEA
jgi:hypothetical protein